MEIDIKGVNPRKPLYPCDTCGELREDVILVESLDAFVCEDCVQIILKMAGSDVNEREK